MQQLIGPTTVTGKTTFQDFFSDDTLFNAVIGLATLSGVLALLLFITVYLICKMRITRRNPIKTDVNPVYGIDYEEKEVGQGIRSMTRFCSKIG